MGVFEPRRWEAVGDVEAAIREAVENPIGCARVRELARGKRDALIISDDYTRQTPVHLIIPILEQELREAGVERDQDTGRARHAPGDDRGGEARAVRARISATASRSSTTPTKT